jgi:hypothetical protein
MVAKQQRTIKRDDPKQSKRFIEAAREAEADETEKGADKAVKKVIRPPLRTKRRV